MVVAQRTTGYHRASPFPEEEMASIDLPRPLQDYFAFAETAPTRNGRRFSITLPYVCPDGRLDKLQWWYHLSPAKEKVLEDAGVEVLRTDASARFQVHIERWLQNTAQVLYGDGAIPQVRSADGPRVPAPAANPPMAAEQPAEPVPAEAGNDESNHESAGHAAFGYNRRASIGHL